MRKFWQIVSFLGLGVLLSCGGNAEEREEEMISTNEYFDVQGLLTKTEEQLRQMDLVLEKEASFAGELEKSTIKPDSAALANELDVFREVDINKPVLSGRYRTTQEEVDGQTVLIFEADEPDELNINYLRVYKDSESGLVERIEALFSSRNILYNSTRLVSMEYDVVEGLNLPQFYFVEGVQKMIFSDKEEYTIKADFIYPD